VPGYIEAPANALAYPWKHFIGGHLGRLGTRDDVAVHQQYMADIAASVRTALGTVDPTPYFQKYGENVWAGVKGYLDAVTNAAAAPVIASTPVCWRRPTCSPRAPPSGSWSRSAWTSATPPMSTPELGKVILMSSSAIRDPLADHLITPQNAAMVLIDYQPSQFATVRSMDPACCSRTSCRR